MWGDGESPSRTGRLATLMATNPGNKHLEVSSSARYSRNPYGLTISLIFEDSKFYNMHCYFFNRNNLEGQHPLVHLQDEESESMRRCVTAPGPTVGKGQDQISC